MSAASLVAEWGGGRPDTAVVAEQVVPVPSPVPAGHTLFLAVTTWTSSSTVTIPSMSATDTRGNDWTYLGTYAVAALETKVHLLFAHVETPLTAADSVSLLPAVVPGVARIAWSFTQWDALIAPTGDLVANDNGGVVNPSPTTGPIAVAGRATVIGAVCMVNPGRVVTDGADTTVLTKYVSTQGTGDRGVVQMYRHATGAGDYPLNATYSTGGQWSAVGAVFTPVVAPPALVPQAATLFLVVAGVEVPVTPTLMQGGVEVVATMTYGYTTALQIIDNGDGSVTLLAGFTDNLDGSATVPQATDNLDGSASIGA